MPRLDGTGPVGMAGKGNGNCNRNGAKMGCSYGISNDRKMSYGKGFGYGAQSSNNSIESLSKDELTFLKNKASKLENNLNNVKNRISELEQDK